MNTRKDELEGCNLACTRSWSSRTDFAEPLAALVASSAAVGELLRFEVWGVLKGGRTQLRVRIPRTDQTVANSR